MTSEAMNHEIILLRILLAPIRKSSQDFQIRLLGFACGRVVKGEYILVIHTEFVEKCFHVQAILARLCDVTQCLFGYFVTLLTTIRPHSIEDRLTEKYGQYVLRSEVSAQQLLL